MSHSWGFYGARCSGCGITAREYKENLFPKCKGNVGLKAASALELLQNVRINFGNGANCSHGMNKYYWCSDCYNTKEKSKLPQPAFENCDHTWKSYTGLSETFDYCTKCDQKK